MAPFHDSIESRFRALDKQLWQTQGFWQPSPFHDPQPAWMRAHPDLMEALLALTDPELMPLQASPQALLAWLQPWIADIQPLSGLCDLPTFDQAHPGTWPFGFSRDIPGRKWQQVEAFVSCLPAASGPLLDWCSGKGHLARAAALVGDRPALGLECDPALCAAGESLAQRYGLPVRFECVDVLDAGTASYVESSSQCIALHACGDLHLRLMEVAVDRRVANLCFSPCCYHKGQRVGGLNTDIARLKPDRDSLRLAVAESVTAKGHERRQRDLEALWRQAFEALWDAVVGSHRPRQRALARSEFRGNFADFCSRRLDQSGVRHAPLGADRLADALQEGARRLARLRRLELLRTAWRRPLELWLCLDRALWLERRGYKVELGTFCDAGLTPRNILLRACRL